MKWNTRPMKLKRLFGTAFVLSSVLAGIVAFSPRAAHSTDLQDSTTLVNHPAADINDVFMFPAPGDSTNSNVVLVMDVDSGLASSANASFDPAVLYQFKVAHTTSAFTRSGSNSASTEDSVIQFLPGSSGTGQTLTMFGPNAPNITGTTSTVLGSSTSSGHAIPFGKSTTFTVPGFGTNSTTNYSVSVYAGFIADRSFFDLARFYQLFPDRNPANHTSVATTAPLVAPTPLSSPLGFAIANCGNPTTPTNYFSGLKTLSIIVEMPKALLEQLPATSTAGTVGTSVNYVHLWATTSTVSGS